MFAVPVFETGVAAVEHMLNIELSPGGRHVGFGTRNALASLGGVRYLEVIGPDDEAPEPQQPRPFGIDRLQQNQLVTWAIQSDDLESDSQRARDQGIAMSDVISMSRRKPDGSLLSWRLAFPMLEERAHAVELLPFLIAWGSSPSPAHALKKTLTLTRLIGAHPEPDRVRAALQALGAELELVRGERPMLTATIRTPSGDEVALSGAS